MNVDLYKETNHFLVLRQSQTSKHRPIDFSPDKNLLHSNNDGGDHEKKEKRGEKAKTSAIKWREGVHIAGLFEPVLQIAIAISLLIHHAGNICIGIGKSAMY